MITGPAGASTDPYPPPPIPTPPPPPPTEPRSRLFNARDHYNAAAEALQQIADHYQDEDFGIQDATMLLQMAQTHAQLGQLKLTLDTHP